MNDKTALKRLASEEIDFRGNSLRENGNFPAGKATKGVVSRAERR